MTEKEFKKEMKRVLKEQWAAVVAEHGPKIAGDFKAELVKRITLQKFNWVPLTRRYARRKQREGKDPRILLRDKQYIKGIRVRHPSKNQWVVDLPPTKHYSGLSYQFLGMVHEFGSKKRNIPARPHWRPVGNDFLRKGPELAKEMEDDLNQRVQDQMATILP